MKNNKRSQEEIVGFALIVVIIVIILVFFLIYTAKKPPKEAIESYEVNNFLQILLQYTSDCADNYEPNYLTVEKLIKKCDEDLSCLDGRKACEVLESDLKEILDQSWRVEENTPTKAYVLNITRSESFEEILVLPKGNKTYSSKGSFIGISGYRVYFTAYS